MIKGAEAIEYHRLLESDDFGMRQPVTPGL